MNKSTYRRSLTAAFIIFAAGIWTQAAAQQPSPLMISTETVTVTFSLENSIQTVYGHNGFWGLPQQYAPAADYPTNLIWAEGYIKPKITASFSPADWITLYGGSSVIAAGTWGKDYFLYGTAGTVQIGEAYVGADFMLPVPGLGIEISGGKKVKSIGNSFILSGGGTNGNERGGLTLAPFKAWNMTGMAGIYYHDMTLTGMYLEKEQKISEIKAGQSPDRLVGFTAEWTPTPSNFLGFAYFNVIQSDSPYPKPGSGIIEGARQGLNIFDLYWKYETYQGLFAGFSFLGEAVIEYNPSIPNTDGMTMLAFGTGMDIGYRFLMLPFTPKLTYSPRYCTGNNPDTSLYERFDGMYWDGSPAGWGSGVNASLSFLNSNLFVQRLKLEVNFTRKDILNISYYYVMAAQTNSPIQFGQTTRPGNTGGQLDLIVGVTDPSISQDLYFEYIHLFNQNWIFTCGIAFSFPMAGIRDLVTDYKDWIGGIAGLIIRY